MKRLLPFFLALITLAHVHGAALGDRLEVTPVRSWKSVDPDPSGMAKPAYPTLKFVPKDGRNAAIILSVLPARIPGNEVTGRETLERFNLMAARPYLPTPEARPPVVELNIVGGLGVYIINEDPNLIGRRVPPNEYRIATSASLLLDRDLLVVCTIFHDDRDSVDFNEAMEILLSVASTHTPSDRPL